MLVPLVIAWPMSIIVSYLIAIDVAGKMFDQTLLAKTRNIAENVIVEPTTGNVRPAVELRTLFVDEDVADYELRIDDATGRVYGSGALERYHDMDVALHGSREPHLRDAVVRNARVRVAAVTVPAAPERAMGALVVQLSEPIRRRETLARQMLLALLPLQLVAIPVAALLGLLGLRQGIKPLKRLSDELSARDAQDFKPLNPALVPREIAPLVTGFNALLARAENENRRQKQFVDNAAHQLRTPIAGLRLTAELALRSDNPADKDAALTAIDKSAQESAHMIDRLLALTRAAHAVPQSFTPVDLAMLVREAVEAHIPAAATKQIDLGASGIETPVLVQGSERLLRELIANLLDNALRYTHRGGEVTVSLATRAPADNGRAEHLDSAAMAAPFGSIRAGNSSHVPTLGSIVLAVDDNGPGVPEDAREHIWERFYRAPRSASVAGTGLGLAIVREIADAHGATAQLARAVPGARFEVSFRQSVGTP
jgi:two-component system sensor histidine kinase TctE